MLINQEQLREKLRNGVAICKIVRSPNQQVVNNNGSSDVEQYPRLDTPEEVELSLINDKIFLKVDGLLDSNFMENVYFGVYNELVEVEDESPINEESVEDDGGEVKDNEQDEQAQEEDSEDEQAQEEQGEEYNVGDYITIRLKVESVDDDSITFESIDNIFSKSLEGLEVIEHEIGERAKKEKKLEELLSELTDEEEELLREHFLEKNKE